MRVAIFITARMGSKRLPDKHFLEIKDNRPAISMLLDAIYKEFQSEISNNLIIPILVTGNIDRNRRFMELKSEYDIQVFFGDDLNIPLRHCQASTEYNIDSIIAIDGDDILISKEAMRKVYQNLADGADYISTSGLPLGMNVVGYSSKILLESVKDYRKKQLDTGWGFIFDGVANKLNIDFKIQDSSLIRATLDYMEDFNFLKLVFEKINPIEINSSSNLCSKIIQKKLYLLNSSVNERYWQNFEKEKQKNVE
ncbi:hypothetical protein N9I81_01470 [Planktomarina temperata]|nr:hypothetical protein [Planktomarina temperata]